MTSFGRIDEFRPENESIEAYLVRIELYFNANEVEDDKKVPIFLSVIGGKTYSVLRDLLAPVKPREKSFSALASELTKHFQPRKIVIAERFHFHRRNQAPEENVADFLAQLWKLAKYCEFGDHLNEALRDRFVCGLKSEVTQKRLLSETNLTLNRAVEIAQGIEAAEEHTQQLKSEVAIKHVSPGNRVVPCKHCGKNNHHSSKCRFKEAICNACHKKGHLAKICRAQRQQRPTAVPKKKAHQDKGTRWVGTEQEADHSDTDSELPLYKINDGSKSVHPITVDMTIKGSLLKMEIDTGAAVSIISKATYQNMFSEVPLNTVPLRLRTYTGEHIPVVGEMITQVQYGSQAKELGLIVVQGEGPSLFGRNWLEHFQLDWKTIGLATLETSQARVDVLLKKYNDVFAEGLGTMKHFQATLRVCPGTTPVFHRPRPIPFAVKDAVDKELERLQQAGIVEKVTHSDWAAPIVVVPKDDGQIRLCGDYKVTVNKSLKVDQHPLPRPDELFAALSRGVKFSKIDLTHAYQQMTLDTDSRVYVTINTHQGLFRYTHLPFGIVSAPAIFQRTMETILQGLTNVQCYIDDILVTGTSEQEHFHNLEEVLKRLSEYGIRVKREKCAFFKDTVEYLGHLISEEGLHTAPKKVEAIQAAPAPQNIQELRSFLGLLHYYGKFIPDLASLVHPLNQLLHSGRTWTWTEECEQAFVLAKKQLTSATVLAHYNPQYPLRLAADASSYGLGAVISHVFPNGLERPIAFASRTLTTSERNYSQLEKEALSLVFAVKKFH